MNNIITFDEKISTYSFYTNVIGRFYEIYKSGEKSIPILDFRNTKYIFPTAAPLLLSFGDYLRRLYKKSVPILYEKRSEVHNFFIFSKFYEISNKLEIFDWGEDVLNEWNYKELRDLHKISYTYTSYSDADKIKEPMQRRDFIFDCLLDKSKVVYENILKDSNQLPEDIVSATIHAIAEIETNAIMYSGSYSFTFVASNRYGTSISVADSGIGFERSFLTKERKMKMLEKFQYVGGKFHNYLVIMSALNYSFEKHLEDKRADLWTLRTNVINNNGTFKIQYENTQVIFSCNRCRGCRKNKDRADISTCVQCLLDKYSMDAYSPIKIFNIGFQGVRIEITINKEK